MNRHFTIAISAAVFFAAAVIGISLLLPACKNPDRVSALTDTEIALIEGRGTMRVLTVNNRDDSLILRAKCTDFPLEFFQTDTYKTLVSRMIATVTDPSQDGVGIAGPQVGLSRRIVVVQRFDKAGAPFEAYPNLRIRHLSQEISLGEEGCLSIPDVSGEVERATSIVINYIDAETRTERTDTVAGFTAVIFQHEADHLDGVLYTDKVSGILRQRLFYADRSDAGRPVSCYRIPAIALAPDGSLVAAVDERVPSCGDVAYNRDINIIIRRSTDGGRTWTAAQSVASYPDGQSASDASMISSPANGTLYLFYNYMDHNTANPTYRFHQMLSYDGGRTWSAYQDITDQVCPAGWEGDFRFLTSGQGAVTESGELLHTMVNIEKGLHLIRSADGGRNWELLPTAITPADESKVIDLRDGRWMINSRVNNVGYRYIHISEDQGSTWKSRPEQALIDPGCNAAIAHYSNPTHGSCLLFVNAADASSRSRLTLRYSTDKGETWSNGLVLVEGDAAYSDLAVLPSGEIAVFYECESYSACEVAIVPPARLFE